MLGFVGGCFMGSQKSFVGGYKSGEHGVCFVER